MSFKHLLFVVGVCAVVASALAVAQDGDYFEEEEVKPAPPPPRTSLLRRPGILSRGKPTPATTSTTPPPPKELPPPEDELSEDELSQEGDEEGQEDLTTTPASKKLKTGVVRPFRSNDDLLAALKRRRAEAANGKGHHVEANNAPAVADAVTESHSAPSSKNNQVGRRGFSQRGKLESSPPPASDEAATTQSSKTSRNRNRFSGRGLYKAPSNDNGEIAGLESSQQIVEVKPRAGFKPGQRRF